MNFLYVKVKRSIYDIPLTLTELGHTVDILNDFEFDILKPNELGNQKFSEFLSNKTYDSVISYIFIPDISNICQQHNIKYISWTYDSPLVSLFDDAIYNNQNYTFIFDKAEYNYFKKLDVPNIYYMPLAANITRTGVLDLTDEDESIYSNNVSFVGGLYEDNSYNSIIHLLPKELADELKLYLAKNLCNWEESKTWPRVSQKVANFLESNLNAGLWNRYNMDNQLYFGMLILTRKLAEMDRITVLNVLAERFDVRLYTTSHSNYLKNVSIYTGVDYYTDMNKVFYFSKINLNITLPSIETGIPQRVFDIMGCGGFVLSNYQSEIDEMFTIGEDLEVFHDIPDLLEKVDYYLNHEEERIKIAINGYKKVRDIYNYPNQMKKIINIVEGYSTCN